MDRVDHMAVEGRDISALLNPRPAVLVSSVDDDGRPNVCTLAWHTPLSHRPPLLGISVGRTRHSHDLIDRTGEFAVNVVDADLHDAVLIYGNTSGRDGDKLRRARAGVAWEPGTVVAAPVVAGALAVLECRVVDRVPCGDHTFFVGSVLAARADPDRFVEGTAGQEWDMRARVLLCLQHDHLTWLGAGEAS